MTVEEIKLTEQKRQDLRDNLRYLNAKQLDMIDEIIKTFGTSSLQKGKMTDIALKDDSVSYDCALPNGLNHSVQDLGLTFESFYNISTYRKENHGSWRVENTAELFVNRLAEVFHINW
jgi:hypothetical protein